MNTQDNEEFGEVLADNEEFIDVTLGLLQMVTADGYHLVEKDYRVNGEVWRVHKTDADPYPSNPHAHCVGGAPRFVGLTLHLGTAELYSGRKPQGRFLNPKHFARLIEMIQPKFPDIELPLPVEILEDPDRQETKPKKQ